MKCCGFVVCIECLLRGSRIGCPGGSVCIQCRRVFSIAHDVIFIGKDVDARQLIADASAVKATEDMTAAGAAHGVSPIAGPRQITSKTEYITALARKSVDAGASSTLRIDQLADYSRNFKGLLEDCTSERPVADGATDAAPSIIVFAPYDESVDSIIGALRDANISCAKLVGSAHDYSRIIGDFKAGVYTVIVVNSSTIFSGIDMPWVTDIVIVEHLSDNNVGQIVGRAQRLGRTRSLRVHFLEYIRSTAADQHDYEQEE